MAYDVIGLETMDASAERDRLRFEKMHRNKRNAKLLCLMEDGESKSVFSENGQAEKITYLDINFVDSEGLVHSLAQNGHTLFKMQIFFASDRRILAAYETVDQPETKFCSWGYKKSSAQTEKLFVYFRTGISAYMVYMDAKNPEYQFLLVDDDTESYNSVQNLYQFMKRLIGKDGERDESIS